MNGHFRQHIEAKYGSVAEDDQEKLMEAIVGLIEYGRDPEQSLHSFLEQVAQLVSRSLRFDEIVIGLYDRKANDYCNEVVFGYGSEAVTELMQLRYTIEDLKNQERAPRVRIGKLAEFSRAEGSPTSERGWHPGLPAGVNVRKPVNAFERGDSIVVWIRNPRMGLVGWIKVSHPHNLEFPPKISVLWLELIASICACVVLQHWHQENRARGSENGQ